MHSISQVNDKSKLLTAAARTFSRTSETAGLLMYYDNALMRVEEAPAQGRLP